MNLTDYNLQENPFRIGPPLKANDIIWAGFGTLKSQIEQRIKIGIQTTPSKIILNWGRYGSGKTHAANYFTRKNRIDEIRNELGAQPVKAIKISLPRTGNDPVQAFFRSFLGQVSLKNILNDIKLVVDRVTLDETINLIRAVSSDSVISTVFEKFARGLNDFELAQMEGYLFGDTTRSTLSKLGLPAGLKDDEQVVNFLSTYINVITQDSTPYSLLVLWVDEFEDIDTLNKISQDRVTTFLRQLFDKSPNKFCLFLNFTPKTFYNIEDLSITLGEALSTRARLRITFEEPSVQEAKNYIDELMNNVLYRPTAGDRFVPFESNNVIFYILDHIGRLSIRKINEVFSLLLELALIYEKPMIDVAFIDQIKDELVAWEQ